jgi:hypothetical protein
VDFKHLIDSNDNGWKDGAFCEVMDESFNKSPANLKNNLGATLLNVPMSFEKVMLNSHSNSKCLISWITSIKNSR